ncbi:MAG: sulfatase-like hydrolase/transferase [Prevotella sp.]|nr:sulfatase-like hydrolase/transferase [Prevotella sp.]
MFRGLRHINPLKWLGWLFSPIRKNGAFFVFMFVLGWICTQLEIMPYYLRNRGAEPYELSAPELFLDIYIVCVLLMLVPKKIRIWVKALLYVFFYGVALVDMFCYERFESTLTPTMLMLAMETTGQEAKEFLSGYLNWDIVKSGVGWILLLIVGHILWTLLRTLSKKMRQRIILPKVNDVFVTGLQAVLGCVVAWLLYSSISQTWDNKVAIHRLFSYDTIGEVEHEMTKKDQAKLYIPVYRLAFGIYANSLADTQIEQLKVASDKIQVDSCSYRVPNIVLVIGESYNKHHSQLYGYQKPTTPRQVALEAEGSLVKFTDVVSTWNLTSFVFKHLFSLYAVGDSGEWCDQPLFPEVFRKAGYHVTFITNQFEPKAKEAVYDFSGGFFLNDPELSKRQFDSRNTKTHRFDDGVLKEYEKVRKSEGEKVRNNLVILHLMGSHVDYRARYPQKTQTVFTPQMYERPELNDKQKQILAHYDNSLLYNDSILAAVTQRFADQDALVIYVPDHGEEIFDGSPYMYGRMHGANIDYRLARNEMEIPFWIWGSPIYRENHPYGWLAIQNAKNRPLMIDALPHLLLYLGGISTPLYREELNIIAPNYDMKRPRILKGVTDYNQLKRP